MPPIRLWLLSMLTLAYTSNFASSIHCYQCSGTDPNNPFVCNEFLDAVDEDELELNDCNSVYGAKYCVKHTGRFEVDGIKCYQCDSTVNLDCSDLLIVEDGSELKPEPCESTFEARYCVKSTGLRGGIGTRRFCSGLDLGNYCNYVQNKGDQLDYRSCIFTCSTDGCNGSSSTIGSIGAVVLSTIVTCYLARRLN